MTDIQHLSSETRNLIDIKFPFKSNKNLYLAKDLLATRYPRMQKKKKWLLAFEKWRHRSLNLYPLITLSVWVEQTP